jgi:quinol-cytochrome oxidoreductase complex cytochrome b subunit
MGVIFIIVTLGVMAYLGYLDFGSTALNAATWALLIISAVLGIFLGKRYS